MDQKKEMKEWHRQRNLAKQSLRRHGEPRAIDWLAAGFWDPITREDEVVIDPMAMLRAELIHCQMNGAVGFTSFDGGEKMRISVSNELFKRWKNGEIDRPTDQEPHRIARLLLARPK